MCDIYVRIFTPSTLSLPGTPLNARTAICIVYELYMSCICVYFVLYVLEYMCNSSTLSLPGTPLNAHTATAGKLAMPRIK